MRLALLRCVTVLGGLALPAGSTFADPSADFTLCTSSDDISEPAVADACDRFIAVAGASASDRAAAYAMRSRIAAADEDYRSALDDADQSIRLAPTANAYLFRGYYRTMLGQRDDAVADYGQSITLSPTPDAYYLRAKIYAQRGEYRKAIGDLNRVVPLVPGEPEPHRWRATSFEALGLHDRAIAEYSIMLGLNDRDAAAFAGRAVSYLAKGNAKAAIIDYSAGLDVKADWTMLAGRARAYREAGNFAAAAADLTQAAKLSPAASVYLQIGDTAKAAGDLRGATVAYQQAVALATAALADGSSPAAHRERGLAYTGLGQIESAALDFDDVIRLAPDDAAAYRLRAATRRMLGDRAQAAADNARATELEAAAAERANAPPDSDLASAVPP
ncbi:MAG TPA: tetratricopeptide repeat protein [Bauldia sp.]|nr:tetratricopeptide repeat protein [Bauldia sp.]